MTILHKSAVATILLSAASIGVEMGQEIKERISGPEPSSAGPSMDPSTPLKVLAFGAGSATAAMGFTKLVQKLDSPKAPSKRRA